MMKTAKPPLRGCKEAKGWLGHHQWNYSASWNGNNRAVLPFVTHRTGIARSGWRCFHCGQFDWDQSDRAFALSHAEALGLIKIPVSGESPREDAARLDFLERMVQKSGVWGISFDCVSGRGGFRLLTKHNIRDPRSSIRAVLDEEMKK